MKQLTLVLTVLLMGAAFLVPAPADAQNAPDYSGVAFLEASLLDAADGELLAAYGPFGWGDAIWLLDSVPLGREMVLRIAASNAQGLPLFRGELAGIWLDPSADPMGIGMLILILGYEGIGVIADPYAYFGEVPLEPVPAALAVGVDIKPGSDRNPLNLRARGVLPVAVLGAKDFDVSWIDASTLTLAGQPMEKASIEDVSGPRGIRDGIADLVAFVRIQALANALAALPNGEVVGLVLQGTLDDDTLIEGVDSVQILKP